MTAGEVSRKALSFVVSRPVLMASELAWRWAFAIGASGVLLYYSSILRDSISLSAADQGALLSGNVLQSIDVGSRIVAGAMPYFVQAAVGALPKIALIWWLCITLGRTSILRTMVNSTAAKPVDQQRRFWFSMTVVHGVRVLLLLIVLSAYLGANRAAAIAFGTDIDHPRILLGMLAFLATFGLGILIYLAANYVAALAPFSVVLGRGALDALAEALQASLRHKAMLGSAATVSATLRTVVAMVISGASILLLPLSRYLPAVVIASFLAILTVVYCALSDVLLLARTMSYAWIVLGYPEGEGGVAGKEFESPLYSAPPDLRS